MRRESICVVATCVFLGIVCASTRAEESVIPASQDRELMKKALTTQVKVNYSATSIESVLKDLARQSGVEIKVDPALAAAWAQSDGGGSGSGGSGLAGYPQEAATELVGEDAAKKLAWQTCQYEYAQKYNVKKLHAKEPMALFAAVMAVAEMTGSAVSCRKGHIYLSTKKTLNKELLITRQFEVTQTWGSIYRVNLNGEDKKFKLSVQDTIANLLDRSLVNGDPTGTYDKLVALNRGYEIKVDAAKKVISVTAPAYDFAMIIYYILPSLNEPPPDELAGAAKKFREAHLAELVLVAWKALPAAEKLRLAGLCTKLDSNDFAVREAAEKALRAAGAASLDVLAKVDLKKASAEQRQRIERLTPLIQTDAETLPALAVAEKYLAAGVAGKLDVIQKDFWTSSRTKEFETAKAEFDKELAAAKDKPESFKEFLQNNGLPASTAAASATYKMSVEQNMKVADPRVEMIRVSGARAEVTFSATIGKQHPHFQAVEDLKRSGIDRPLSTFFMEYINNTWRVADPGPISDEEAVVWKRSTNAAASTVRSNSSVQQSADGDRTTVTVGASAYAISFGY